MYNTEKFIDKSKKIHGYKYDYSLVDYKKSNIKVKIICLIHGIFNQLPSKHLSGQGCNICGGSKKYTTKEFIEKSKEIHGDIYNYSLLEYKGIKSKVKIICSIHGIFEQKSESHLNGSICKRCYFDGLKKTTEQFIIESKKVHGDSYDYFLTNYINNKIKVKIICPIHGIFNQLPTFHIRGQGCKYCADNNKTMNIIDFIKKSKKVHGDSYDYSNSNYVNNYTKVEIICRNHGLFKQAPNYHMLGQGCPDCQSSLLENKVKIILDNNNIKYEQQKKFKNCKNKKQLPFDFYLSDYNICIECNGKQHYEPIEYFGGLDTYNYIKNNDIIKKTFCNNNNIKLYLIPYYMLINNIEKLINDIKKK